MFRKLHTQMTLFSAAVTGGILILMTLVCLFIAENGTKQNSYTTFSQNAQACISYLETQTILSHSWIQKTQSNYDLSIKITDNQKPLFFDKLHLTEEEQAAFEKASELALKQEGLDLSGAFRNSRLTSSAFFTMKDYYVCVALIPKSENNFLSVVILHSLSDLNQQLVKQRLAFFAVVVLAVFALFIFSWFFTKKNDTPAFGKSQTADRIYCFCLP